MWDKSDFQISELKVYLVNKREQTIDIVNKIKMKALREPTKDVVLGMDCEGLNVSRPISLLQMHFGDTTYIFDLLSHNPFEVGLKEILQSKRYVKVFHDFCEDATALLREYKVTMNGVFDTQIAHRELTIENKTYDYQDSNIALNSLLQKYLRVENSKKSSISTEMKGNDQFWEQRPLTSEMIEYASQDVMYLPSIYFLLKSRLKQATMNLVLSKSYNCQYYSLINKNHPGIYSCKRSQYISAYIKNYHKFGIFCSLNIGSTGIVIDEISRKFIESYFQVGEILNLEIVSINIWKNSIELKVPGYYLDMDDETIKQYCKLIKTSQEDKNRKAVVAIAESATKFRKSSMNLTAKAFIPKEKCYQKAKSASFDATIKDPLLSLKSDKHFSSALCNQSKPLSDLKMTI